MDYLTRLRELKFILDLGDWSAEEGLTRLVEILILREEQANGNQTVPQA